MTEIREAATQSPLTLPAISSLPDLSAEERAQVLDLLFEPCVQLHTLSVSLLHEKKFSSYHDLVYDGVGKQLSELIGSELHSDREWLDKILQAHPRLGEKKTGGLSANSAKEQESMRREGEGQEIAERLGRLNKEYEKAFEGLKYVTFVNGRSRPVIMEDMEMRIKRGDLAEEKKDAVQAMCDIAMDRAKKMGGS